LTRELGLNIGFEVYGDGQGAAWDEDIKRDFAPGAKGEPVAKEIHREISEGTARPLEEGLAKRRRSHL
jgi:hypothetical protein